MASRRKLIEIALPLEGIDRASAREKEPFTRNHPRSLHIWWARRPLAACRTVLFASLIDDPDQEGVPSELLQCIDRLPVPEKPVIHWHSLTLGQQRRQKLLALIERLALWESANHRELLDAARELIQAATGGNPPPVLDPFCGGGSIPIEAQRLGLEAHAGDLNPVAVLITRALIEIPASYAGRAPVNPKDRTQWTGTPRKGAAGLAADIRYYGEWLYREAERRLGHLYPKVDLPPEKGGGKATAIAWLWARTVRCPNPSCGGQMPLARTFWLSTKKGRMAWIEPQVEPGAKSPRFAVRTGEGQPPSGTVGRRGSTCLLCGAPVDLEYIRSEGRAGHIARRLMAVVAEGWRSRVYLSPEADATPPLSAKEQALVHSAQESFLSGPTPQRLTGGTCHGYGLSTWGSLFTPRQTLTLAILRDLVMEAHDKASCNASAAGLPPGEASGYASVVSTYLALSLSRWMDLCNTLASWNTSNQNVRALFARHAIPMAWDFVELSPFGPLAPLTSFFKNCSEIVAEQGLAPIPGLARQQDAAATPREPGPALVCTDPPYYDNVAYADLSDFFYVWLRHCLGRIHPELFASAATPKARELVAAPYRFDGDKAKAKQFFEGGLGRAFARMREIQHPDYPLTLFYGFKPWEVGEGEKQQAESAPPAASAGWEAMLEGLISAGFAITATWPMRSERRTRSVALGTNALAHSILLVCRPRPVSASPGTRDEFVAALKGRISEALQGLRCRMASADLAQAAIGSGMAVFSQYAEVLEPDGKAMSVRTALALINQVVDEVLAERESDHDAHAPRPQPSWGNSVLPKGPPALRLVSIGHRPRGHTLMHSEQGPAPPLKALQANLFME